VAGLATTRKRSADWREAITLVSLRRSIVIIVEDFFFVGLKV